MPTPLAVDFIGSTVLPYCMGGPAYSLALIKGLMKDGSWYATGSAVDGAGALGFDEEDICECVVNQLDLTHFYKTMDSEKKKGLKQDVYRITYKTKRVYIKLQVCVDAVVISFKEED